MTKLTIDERLRRLSRTAEMSAGIMRDPERTGGWPGAEKTAMAFDRIKDTVDEIRAALPPVAPAGDDLVCDCQQWPTHVSNECPVHNLFPDPPPEPAAPAGDREAVDETAKAEGMDEAADFVLEHLAKALGLTTFEPQEGTETWDGDVVATLNHILIAAGVVDGETGSLRILHPEHSAVIDAAAKYAEQRRIGRLFTDQDVLDACAALDRARTGSEAQIVSGSPDDDDDDGNQRFGHEE